MERLRPPALRFSLALFATFAATTASAQEFGETVTIAQPLERDLYAAGRRVTIAASVSGDAAVAGQTIRVAAPVGGDLMAAGETVEITAPVGDDIRAAGQRVVVNARVADHVVGAGESLWIGEAAAIGGFAWLAGADLRIDGSVGAELRTVGRRVELNGAAGADVTITADTIIIGPEARVAGNLIWRSENPPVISPGAAIGGKVIGERVPPAGEPVVTGGVAVAVVLAALVVSLTGVALYLLVPEAASRTASTIREVPVRALAAGVGLLVGTPVALLLLFISTLGVLLGLLGLAAYALALPLGWFAGAYCTSEYALRLTGRREGIGRGLQAAAFAGTAIALLLLQFTPVIGWLVAVTVLLFGLGGIAVTAYRGCRPTDRQEA